MFKYYFYSLRFEFLNFLFPINFIVFVMAKETIQIRIDEETAKIVNLLLGSGLFKTKSEALRYILSLGITAANRFPEVYE